ncbi:hypothetical protein [Magnetospirillum sp. LM-5]|uniref:hypothetical protein n=1 Tax=Magnetospirillum sp. LM-5 TaxID=2681466 RepID=UPI00156D5B87|nr:hypothetical protein [Magnetospirillum sp. LM-5]
MPVDADIVSRRATGLLQRHGSKAVVMAAEEAESASRAGDLPALDLALMVLTEVERHQAATSNL